MTRTTPSGQTRRAFALGTLGAVGGAVLLTACGDDAPGGTADAATTPPPTGDGPDAALADAGTTPPPPGDTADAATTPPPPPGDMADAGGQGTCTLYPKETEGPFYLDLNDLRVDIKDGKAGAPLHLVIKV